MTREEKEWRIAEARAIASFGFERGMAQAIDFLDGLAEGAADAQSRQFARIAALAMREVMPQMVEAASAGFTFDYIETAGKEPEIKLRQS